MSFTSETEERQIETDTGQKFKIFITEHEGGYWISTVVHIKDGEPEAKHFSETNRRDAYQEAAKWASENIKGIASIEPL